MTTTQPAATVTISEDLAEGGTWLLDLVAAVDHLRRGHRPNLTVWDALTEAIRDANNQTAFAQVDDTADPTTTLVERLGDQRGDSAAAEMQAAIRRWVTTMAERYNNGRHWPHPTPRRRFPPPMLQLDEHQALGR